MIVLIGHSGSGKDTVLNELIKEHGFKSIVSYTTRPPRCYEINGIDYRFIGDQEFDRLLSDDFFANHVIYRGWHYGISKKDCVPGKVVIVDPHGLKQILSLVEDVTVIHVFASEEVRRSRLFSRQDDPVEIKRRIDSDRELFAGVYEASDFVLVNNSDDIEVLKKDIAKFVCGTLRPYLERKECKAKRSSA